MFLYTCKNHSYCLQNIWKFSLYFYHTHQLRSQKTLLKNTCIKSEFVYRASSGPVCVLSLQCYWMCLLGVSGGRSSRVTSAHTPWVWRSQTPAVSLSHPPISLRINWLKEPPVSVCVCVWAVKRVCGSSLIRVSALSVSREATLREMKLEAPVQNECWFIPAKRAVY